MEFSLLWFSQDTSRKTTAFSHFCTTVLSSLPFSKPAHLPLLAAGSGVLSLPHHHYNLHPGFILLCSLITDHCWAHCSRSSSAGTNPSIPPVHPRQLFTLPPNSLWHEFSLPAAFLSQWLLFLSKAQTDTVFLVTSLLGPGSSAGRSLNMNSSCGVRIAHSAEGRVRLPTVQPWALSSTNHITYVSH